MRILLTSHQPFHQGIGGANVYRLFERLSAAGHQVRVLLAGALPCELGGTRTVICSPDHPAADYPQELPTLYAAPFERRSFASLDDEQLGAYREALRSGLDDEIAAFHPHIVHAQHLWIDGHLALESGAPYVATAYASELAAAESDSRFERYVRETAENAGRILIGDSRLERQLGERYRLPPEWFAPSDVGVEELIDIYRRVSESRFGSF